MDLDPQELLRRDMQKVPSEVAHAIRRKPLRASTTIANSRPPPADAAAVDVGPSIPRKLHRASTTIAVLGTSGREEGEKPANAPLGTLQRALTIARKPLGLTMRSLSTPNLLSEPKARIEESPNLWQDASSSESLPIRNRSIRRLSKPPRVHVRKQNARTKLQKRHKKNVSTGHAALHVFLLQYEQYPYNTKPGTLLGAFSTFHTVTTGAIKHGAFAFSKEGMHDGTEYLSKTGRIKILPTPVERLEARTRLPSTKRTNNWWQVGRRPGADAPTTAPATTQATGPIAIDGKQGVLVAAHQSPTGIYCIGAFTNRRAAWGACLKHSASQYAKDELQEQERWIDECEMPHLRAREVGQGWHEWFVVALRIDEAIVQTAAAAAA